ncbi:hypothetical protein [Microlunatus antarcticus]|uniref:Uncharacterized protein n=1 Tax=Microlunatus antarcticus TaxID=53388 RepID=A0A7W5P5H6_9ACTN|nr:hypothetical protein [Microlunatus antarcticus]MBB3325490.1 hypothetical protein [Microlunatus antarcticus]
MFNTSARLAAARRTAEETSASKDAHDLGDETESTDDPQDTDDESREAVRARATAVRARQSTLRHF